MDLMVEASPRRVFANAHTYHINSISVNSDNETYLSADDLRINLWHLEITDRSFSILLPAWGSMRFREGLSQGKRRSQAVQLPFTVYSSTLLLFHKARLRGCISF